MAAPDWLKADPLAAILLRRGMHSDEVCTICERAAIVQHDGKLSELDAIIEANGSCPHELRTILEQPTSQKDAQ